MRWAVLLIGFGVAFLQIPAAHAERPCLSEVSAYVDESTDVSKTSAALSYCLAIATLPSRSSAGTGDGLVVLEPNPNVRDTWIVLPPDVLRLLQDNGYGNYISNGGIWIGSNLNGSPPSLVLPENLELPPDFQSRAAPNLIQPQETLPTDLTPGGMAPDGLDGGLGGFEGGGQ